MDKSAVFHTLKWIENTCVIDFNVPEKTLNSFSKDSLEELEQLLDEVLQKPALDGIVFTSSKKECFAAGVDVSIFATLKTKQDGEAAAKRLQDLFLKFEKAKVPTVAAIHGVCLGGGLELSLAMKHRVCSLHKSTQIGLPEVQLGLLPGGGGTQRLPRLIGIVPALDLILTGKKVDAKKALRLGIVDDAVPENMLLDRALAFVRGKSTEPAPKQLSFLASLEKQMGSVDVAKMALEGNPLGRSFIEKKSLEMIEKSTKGFYPAPKKALESVIKGIGKSLKEGLALEAKLFGELVASPECASLVHIFDIMTAAKKNPFSKAAQEQARQKFVTPLKEGRAGVGIIGAGLMGSGIATVLADRGIRSVLLDRNSDGVQRGVSAVNSYFSDRLKRKRIKRFECQAAQARVTPSVSYDSLKSCHFVVEAVFEELSIKHKVVQNLEAYCPDVVLATNTSSIPIDHVAAGASKPENVVGMHFFSPVPKMPLVEIIMGSKTSEVAGSATFDISAAMGKHTIVVKDGPGFYTTRILAFYLAEALLMLSEGGSIEGIDDALEAFGMPVGPLTLLDEVGLDVGGHILETLRLPFKDRLVAPPEISTVLEEKRFGRKNSLGFYKYEDGKKQGPDESIYKHFKHGSDRKNLDKAEIVDRCVLVFINESSRCLEEGIVPSEDAGDLGAVFGLGYPPFLGGPFFHAKTFGKPATLEKLKKMAEKYGARFAPTQWWSKN